jgi:hypothetical protein
LRTGWERHKRSHPTHLADLLGPRESESVN